MLHTRKSLFMAGLVLSLMLLASPAWSFWGFSSSKKKAAPSNLIATFQLKGGLPDVNAQFSLFKKIQTYGDFLSRLRRAGKDKNVKVAVFYFKGLRVRTAKAQGIHDAILRLNRKGKLTVAVLESATATDYLIASACKKVMMVPTGMLYLPGLRIESLYLKGMLDKLGIAGDFVTAGAFKSAPEPYTRTEMSDAQKKQLNFLLDGLGKEFNKIVAHNRKIKPVAVQAMIDKALIDPKVALKGKLLDKVADLPVIKKYIQTQVPKEAGKKVRWAFNYGLRRAKKPTSLWSLFTMLWKQPPPKTRSQRPKIAVVYASGAIQQGSPQGNSFNNTQAIYSDSMLRTLRKVGKLKNLRAIVLRVNSPGGSALASDLIWAQLEKLKKKAPLYVSFGDVAASGGYYISMGADAIFAQPSTITGSIGVFAGKMVLSGTMEKLGVNVQVISRGKQSGIFSPFSKFSELERATLKKMIEKTYKEFVTKAAKGRKLKYEQLLKVAGGRVWTGRQALKVKLVDKLGGLHDTIEWAIQRTGLKVRPQVISFPRPKGLFAALQTVSSAPQKGQPPRAAQAILMLLSKLNPQVQADLNTLFLQQGKNPLMMWTSAPTITW